MRKRNNTVTVRVNDEELKVINERISLSGMTKQSYLINALMGAKTVSKEEVALWKDVNARIADIQLKLRGIGTNINQMAHRANAENVLSLEQRLIEIGATVEAVRRECEEPWRSLRYLIAQQKAAVE